VSDPIRTVIVAGSGAAAWITAAGLRRALHKQNLEVTVVDTGPEVSLDGAWTLPSQRGIHALLAINESHFIQHTGATFRLGTEHWGWQGDGSRFLHAHGDIGTDLGAGTAFYKYLQAELIAGRAGSPEDWSLAGVAARTGRFARPMGTDLTASFTYGFHVDEARYAAYLRAHAQKLGVRAAAASWAETLVGEAGIEGLRLADGSVTQADLYVDCTGTAARLRAPLAGEREDWSSWLPCDSMLAAAAPPLSARAAVTQTLAGEAGWCWRVPVADGTLVGIVYSSRFMDEERAFAALSSCAPGIGAPVRTRFASGRRRDFWVGNCLALGAAALELEPLAGAGLHFAQVGLASLVELFPRDRDSRVEAVEYNRVMREQADALRDFTLAHYLAGRARPGGFWNAVRSVAPPERLADKLSLYASNGRIVLQDHETFEETDWAWLMLGSGVVPAAMELQVSDHLAKLSPRDLQALHTRIQQLASTMPPHDVFVRGQSAPAPR
jgi:tryptophan halogenase